MGTARTICFANQKGGVGKTTCAVNIAACLARSGRKVLFIDLDPQGNATSGVGIHKKSVSGSVYDLLIGRKNCRELIMRSSVKGLDVIPSSIDLVGAEIELVDTSDRENRLKSAVSGVAADYDYIIIDCPPSLGLLTINAFTATKYVVIPVLCEYYSLEGLSQLTVTIKQIKRLYNPDIELLGVLINMYDGRLNLTIAVLEEIKRFFAGKIFRTPIPRSVKISEAPSHGLAITDYDRNGKGAAAFAAVTKELIDRCEV